MSMGDVVFARTRTVYGSYADYWRLVELNGYPTCYIDDIPSSGVKNKTFIVTPVNGEWQENGIKTDGRVIAWDLEWRMDGPVHIPGLTEYWHMDAWTAARIGARYVPVGGDARLYEEAAHTGVPYNVAYLGYMIPRRQQMWAWLQDRGLRLSPTSAWGKERAEVLNNSIAYLHVHQWDNAPGVPALRMVVAAAYGLPVISETFADEGIFSQVTLQADFYRLAGHTALWAQSRSERLVAYGDALHDLLCREYTFRKGVEAAL